MSAQRDSQGIVVHISGQSKLGQDDQMQSNSLHIPQSATHDQQNFDIEIQDQLQQLSFLKVEGNFSQLRRVISSSAIQSTPSYSSSRSSSPTKHGHSQTYNNSRLKRVLKASHGYDFSVSKILVQSRKVAGWLRPVLLLLLLLTTLFPLLAINLTRPYMSASGYHSGLKSTMLTRFRMFPNQEQDVQSLIVGEFPVGENIDSQRSLQVLLDQQAQSVDYAKNKQAKPRKKRHRETIGTNDQTVPNARIATHSSESYVIGQLHDGAQSQSQLQQTPPFFTEPDLSGQALFQGSTPTTVSRSDVGLSTFNGVDDVQRLTEQADGTKYSLQRILGNKLKNDNLIQTQRVIPETMRTPPMLQVPSPVLMQASTVGPQKYSQQEGSKYGKGGVLSTVRNRKRTFQMFMYQEDFGLYRDEQLAKTMQ